MSTPADYNPATAPQSSSVSSTNTITDPFDNTHSTSDCISALPARPTPAAHPPTLKQKPVEYISEQRSSWSDRGASPDTLVNSRRESSNTIDEKQWQKIHNSKRQRPSADLRQKPSDPEKAAAYTSPRSSQPLFYNNSTERLSLTPSRHSLSSIEAVQARHAFKILLFLSGPCVALAFVNLIWALVALLVTLLFQPLRLCTSRPPFAHQISHFLAPTLNLQLRWIYTPPSPRPNDDDNIYSAFWLTCVHLLAPILGLGIAIAAWVVAMYWGLARIVGDPSGVDKRDDGVEAVLGLRRWWERFLLKAVRDARRTG